MNDRQMDGQVDREMVDRTKSRLQLHWQQGDGTENILFFHTQPEQYQKPSHIQKDLEVKVSPELTLRTQSKYL